MIRRLAFRGAAALFRLGVRRTRHHYPPGSDAAMSAHFEAAQAAAWDAGGVLGLVRYWIDEARSLLRLRARRDSAHDSGAPDAAFRPAAGLQHDVRDAWRALAGSPGYTALVVTTLAIGIGANTAIFSIVDALLFKPLPYAAADRLVRIAELHPTGGWNTVSPENLVAWRRAATSFAGIEARHAGTARLAMIVGNEPSEVVAARVSSGYFALLGVAPQAGRLFTSGDDLSRGPCEVVVSHRLWTARFGASPGAIGSGIRLGSEACEIVGVLPRDSVFDRTLADVYTAIVLDPDEQGHFLNVYARLRPGVTVEQAGAEMVSVAAAVHRARPERQFEWSAEVRPLRDVVVRDDARRLVWVLFAAVGVVLLVACVNVAGLTLSRGIARQREVAVRMSLGASRWRIIRHLTVEGLLLASAGAALGLLAAAWMLTGAEAVLPAGALPAEAMAALDWRTLGFTAAVAVATALLAAFLPAWQTTRTAASDALRAGGRSVAGSRGVRRLHALLLAGEIALATVLIAGAALLVVSFSRLVNVNPGFPAERLLTFNVLLADSRASDDARLVELYARIVAELDRLGNVESAAAITSLPLAGWRYGTTFAVEGVPNDANRPSAAHIQVALGPYFETIGIPIVEGRSFPAFQRADGQRELVVNQTFARRFLTGGPAVGRRVRVGGPADPAWTVVGVMQDIKTGSLDDETPPEIYVPFAQSPNASVAFAVRTATEDPRAVLRDVASAVALVDPSLPIGSVRTMHERLSVSVELQRFQTATMTGLAGMALIIACLGVFAVRSQAVAGRTREIGIRLALGSTPRDVLRLSLGQGAPPILIGLVVGMAVAIYGARVIERWLFDTPSADPLSVGAAALLIALAATAASWIPARRAARVDPIVALRAD